MAAANGAGPRTNTHVEARAKSPFGSAGALIGYPTGWWLVTVLAT